MREVAVVIPVYRTEPDSSELKSFVQCLTVLGNYPIILVVPYGFNAQHYEEIAGKKIECAYFGNRYFRSTISYSRLLVSPSFYKRFSAYKYILIYQLDAWVFRDELSNWCSKDFDYIGAPWLEVPPFSSKRKPIINLSKRLYLKVGNGGLSLRKVKTHYRWAPWLSFIFMFIPKNEDVLWTLFVPFKKPGYKEALAFAFEMNASKAFAINGNKLPFACHAWKKYEPNFWEEIASLK